MTALALGADHAGFPLEQDLTQWLVAEGHTVVDVHEVAGAQAR